MCLWGYNLTDGYSLLTPGFKSIHVWLETLQLVSDIGKHFIAWDFLFAEEAAKEILTYGSPGSIFQTWSFKQCPVINKLDP